MVTSHECKEDYEYFYKSMAMITANLNIPLKISYLMQDASQSEFQGLKAVYLEAVVVMCYFHVKENVVKNYSQYSVPVEKRQQVSSDITYIPTIAINESFNKQFKETFTKYKMSPVIDMFKKTLPTVIRYYSEHPKPFALYPSQINHRPEVVTRAKKFTKEQFVRFDFNTIRCDCISKAGISYCHFIRIYAPIYCCCYTFCDLAYCHHILALNRLQLANITLDPTYIEKPEPRRLHVRKTKRGRPVKIKGKALTRD